MNVTFEEEALAPRTQSMPRVRGLYALMIRWGFAKDGKQAEIALIVVIVSAFVLAIGIWMMGGAPEGPTPQDVIRMQREQGV